MYKTFESSFEAERESEKDKTKIREIKTCSNNSEIKAFTIDLKIHEVLSYIPHKIAKGNSRINICIIIYLNEYENIKFIKPNVVNVLIIPSNEVTSKEASFDI